MRILTNSLFALGILTATAYAYGGDLKDPNVEKEGNRVLVKREACIAAGGHVTDTDKRYFMCENGKYDGYITSGPVSEPEGDADEEL